MSRSVVRAALRHAPFAALVLVGAALRAVTWRAMWPALMFSDSWEYLFYAAHPAPTGHRPVGYSLFLALLSPTGHVAVATLAQHVLAILVAVLLYLLMLRTGIRPWLAALACAPLLLDAFQIVIEQYVLSETLAEALLAAGVAVLLWPARPGWKSGLAAGALLATAALTRSAMLPVIAPAALLLLLRVASRRDLVAAGCLAMAFVVPLAAYVDWNHEITGRYAFSDYTGYVLYGRVGPFADCSRLTLTAEQRVLCPVTGPGPGREQNPEWYLFAPASPLVASMTGVPVVRRDAIALDFATAVIEQQPLDYARVVGLDTLRSFTAVRASDANWPLLFSGQPSVSALTTQGFQRSQLVAAEIVRPHESPRLVGFLAWYEQLAYLPGPLLAALLVAGVAGAAGLVRRSAGNRRLRWLAFLMTGMAVVLLVTPTMTVEFELRYLLPTFVLLPPAAGAAAELGLRAIEARGGRWPRRPPRADRQPAAS